MPVDADKLPGQNSSGIDISSEGFKGLVVAKYLRCRGCRHWGYQKRVSHSVFLDLFFEIVPIIHGRFFVPEVEL